MNADERSLSRPDLSVIVLSWNVRELLRACLGSLLRNTATFERYNVETFVVDNASVDGSADMVATEFREARLIRNSENIGFARANNQGIAVSSGRYVLLLNCDTLVPPGTLQHLVAFLDAHPEAGACSPRLLRPNGMPQPYAFGKDPTLGYLLRRELNQALFRRPLHDWAVSETIEVDWVSGACLVARRQAIEQVGGLDEAFFMYFEDNDWCRRMRLAGRRVYYVPTVSITHIGGAGLKQNPVARAAYYRSLAYFYRKHYGRPAQAILGAALAIRKLVIGRH